MGEKIKNSKTDDHGNSIPSIKLSGAEIIVDSDEFTEIKIDSPEPEPIAVDVVNHNNNDQHLPLSPQTPPPQATKITRASQAQPTLTAVDDTTTVNGDIVDSGNNGGYDTPPYGPSEKSYVYYHGGLPKPEPPRGLLLDVSPDINNGSEGSSFSSPETFSSIGNFIKQRSNSLSAAIARRLSLKENEEGSNLSSPPLRSRSWSSSTEESHVTEIKLSGVKVIVQQNADQQTNDNTSTFRFNPYALRGRVTFYSRSNCRDCSAVRSFVRSYGLNYVEINVDVFRSREKEMLERTGSFTVPQIFFNEKLIGGLVALNSMRNSGELEKRLLKLLSAECPGDAPSAPVYGSEDEDDEWEEDGMAEVFRVLRCRLVVHDRLVRMRIVKNCFSGNELVEVLRRYSECSRVKAVEIGKELARKHFVHHIFGGNDFQDGNQNYRLIEHEPFIPKCYNFRGMVDEMEPKPAAEISLRLAKLMFAILESYASDDRHHVDYLAISKSEEFRRYLKLIQGLHRIETSALSPIEKLAFFLNLHNAMVIHAVIRIGHPEGLMDRKSFMSDFQYLIGGQAFSISAIKNGILRSNRRPPYAFVKPFINGDKRLELALPSVNPLIHFGLCDGTRSSPTLRFFTSQNVEAELRTATREFFQQGGIDVDLNRRTAHLTRIIKWFSADFGDDRQILKWVINYVDASNAGLLTHLLNDGGFVDVSYLDYDWSLNS